MRTCFVVPGILGSVLYTPDNPDYLDRPLWIDVGRLALGEFPGLTLDAAGVGPGPPHGELCLPGSPLSAYYGTLTFFLAAGLSNDRYEVRQVGYDWRKSIFTAGDLLAAQIRNYATPADPCSIVAHSQGGLVARCAWAVLLAAGQSNLIRRIVTLGTPHRGSYAPAMVWSLQEELLTQLSLACNVLAGVDTLLGPPQSLEYVSLLELTRITATWPSMYQLLPLVDSASRAGDPLRPALFNPDNWPAELHLSSLHLLSAVNAWKDFLRDPASMPPYEVLTTLGGSGRNTPFYLDSVADLGSPAAIGFSEFGDGRVMLDSSVLLPGRALVVASGHGELPSQPIVLAEISGLVLEERPPPPQPAVAQEELSNGLVIMAGPPSPAILGSRRFVDCRDGTCYC